MRILIISTEVLQDKSVECVLRARRSPDTIQRLHGKAPRDAQRSFRRLETLTFSLPSKYFGRKL
eukprot:6184036-Pleurochrysis_carterae.AAC.4